MKVIFNPQCDNGYYVNMSATSAPTLGTMIVGMAGLLEYLCLRTGRSGQFDSDGERAADYLVHVKKYASGTMIDASFQNDSLGVTKCILNWRDSLIMAGWDPSNGGTASTPKLQLLSNIEQSWKAQKKGTADRWRELSQMTAPIVPDDSIECRCARESLPHLVQDVLTACGATFVEYPADMQIPEGANIRVVHYKDLSDAYRQVAANIEDYKDKVIINRDNVSLNHILFSWGKPLVGATIDDSNPLTLQLFKLAMSVFSRPLNIHNLLSYLQLPVGPVPGRLRHALANVLIQEGGFGAIDWNDLDSDKARAIRKAGIDTRWDLAIYDYINDEDGDRRLTKKQRESKTTLLRYITDTTLSAGTNIPVDMLNKYIGAMTQWAAPIANSSDSGDEMLKSQLGTVISFFRQLSNALSGITDISYQDLDKHVRTIYQPTTITQAHAQVGSLCVVSSCQQLIDTPEKLLWLDCCNADGTADQYEFLSTTEREWLNGQTGVTIPQLQDILALNRKAMIDVLSRVQGEITLVTSDYYHNQMMTEHPVIAELKMQRGDSLTIEEGITSLPLSGPEEVKELQSKLQYDINPVTYDGRSESNTSIDTLINYPFDYTVHYIARLSEPSQQELGSLQKVIGLVAHSFVQSLVDSVKDKPEADRVNEMSALLDGSYDDLLSQAIRTTGLSLLLKENEMDYHNFHDKLRHSIKVLIEIMKKESLTPVGCEMKYDTGLGDPINDFNARIDMELKDAVGNAVIFDFKWSDSKSYGEKIKEGKAIQLELYRQELQAQGKTVKAVGYYLFPKCVLETPDFNTLNDASGKVIIDHIDPPSNDIFSKIKNSISQRRAEIAKGNIEEGEGMDIIEQPYSQRSISSNDLLPVGNAKTDKKTKTNPDPPVIAIKKDSNKVFTNKPTSRFSRSTEDFSSTDAPLNEQPTTYPLMKRRLK